MRTLRLIICFSFLTVLFQAPAFAARLEEVVEPRGLFLLSGINQSVSLVYEHAGTTSNSSSSSSEHLWEKYHIGTNISVTDPHLLNIQLDGDIMFDQNYASYSNVGAREANGVQYQYSLIGSAFDRSSFPVIVTSVREINTITNSYTPSYTIDSSVNGLTLSYQHLMVPLHVRLERRTLESSGLTQDYSTTTNAFQFTAQHAYKDISSTGFDLSVTDEQRKVEGQDQVSAKGYSLTLANNVAFDPLKKYVLDSQLQLQSTTGTTVPQTALNLTESFNARFGKSLQAALNYFYSYYKTLNFNNERQTTSSNGIGAMVTHRLFSSLETRLTGKVANYQTLGGHESSYSGGGMLTYRKTLPATSDLTVSLSGDHQVTDRQVTESTVSVRDERFANVQQGDIISLKTVAKSYAVVSITNSDQTITYVVGRDYTVFETLGRIEIVTGGQIVSGSTLLVSYTAEIDPSVKYSTDTVTLNGVLSLFKNHYRIKGSMLRQDQHRISGPAINISLVNTRSDQLQVEALYPSNTFTATFAKYAANTTQYTYVEGGWRYDRQFAISSVTFTLRDRYTMYDNVGLTPRYDENMFEAGSGYSRLLFSWMQASMSLNYVDTHRSDLDRQYFYVKAGLQGRISKLFLSLTGQSVLRIYGSQSTRDDYVRVEVKRYF
ncbi:hypothetical protein [Geobacter sp. AOG2]|uniref:hypothetical protein n=1 Tax=Geobacter sp. AOG2 TaxID=1566347 RepID=UPI001CC75BBC|nr:hypothetical protein [Geobacter sp. AOG2]GFE62108.1 hypothetical protein AOG2_26960 [Geobacter sp. AOG2]